MIRPTRTWRAVAVCGAAALVLAACGSESSDKKSSDSGGSGGSAAKGDGTLTIGTLLPQTGDLAFLGPPEFAGVQLAVDEINKAGGIKGKKIVKVDSDSGDGTPDIAGASVDKLLAQNADVIVGAASSNVSKSVIDKITGAGVVQFSPANTAAGFDTYPDKGLYFRTAPSDVLQGKVVANVAVEDGNKNIAVLARQTSTVRASPSRRPRTWRPRVRMWRPRCSTTPRRRTSRPRSTRSRPRSRTPSSWSRSTRRRRSSPR